MQKDDSLTQGAKIAKGWKSLISVLEMRSDPAHARRDSKTVEDRHVPIADVFTSTIRVVNQSRTRSTRFDRLPERFGNQVVADDVSIAQPTILRLNKSEGS